MPIKSIDLLQRKTVDLIFGQNFGGPADADELGESRQDDLRLALHGGRTGHEPEAGGDRPLGCQLDVHEGTVGALNPGRTVGQSFVRNVRQLPDVKVKPVQELLKKITATWLGRGRSTAEE